MAHLVRKFYDAGVVVAVQTCPLQINVSEPAGVKGTGGVISNLIGIPSCFIRSGVYVIEVPAISALGSDVRKSDHRIVGDFLLHVQQVAVNIRGENRLATISVKERLFSPGSVITLSWTGRDGERSGGHLRRSLEDWRGGSLLCRGGGYVRSGEASGHAAVKSSIEDVRYLARTGIVVEAVSSSDHKSRAQLHCDAEPRGKIVLG